MTKDEKAEREWSETYKKTFLYLFDKMLGDTANLELCVDKLIEEAFHAGCAHKEKQYERLMGWAKQIRFAARNNHVTQTWLQARAGELDEILKEVESGE